MNNTLAKNNITIVTAGSTYLDIDAYACSVAMAELLQLKGKKAIAYSNAPYNYSVCDFLVHKGQISKELPSEISTENSEYIIVDVSDPVFLESSVPLDKVVAVYDHHVGFEEFWADKIGEGTHIEFLGAAATLIYREWKAAELQKKMSRDSALLLLAAILDNTLNLTSANTTPEDIEVFNELCKKENISSEWCEMYFLDVQKSVEADLRNALFNDIKTIHNNSVLPSKIAQLCVWDAKSIIERLSEIRSMFTSCETGWMINIIDIKHRCCYFVCDDIRHQNEIEKVFEINFQNGVAKTPVSYLRKEIIKKAYFDK